MTDEAPIETLKQRRQLLKAGTALGTWLWVGNATASSDELAAAIRSFAAGALVKSGRVLLDIAPIVDNGNTVPLTVSVDSPMTVDDHVTAIAIFNERNPQREVAKFSLRPRSGRARIATRIRLATTQQLVAVARMSDGSCWSHTVNVNVSIAACLEEVV
jgi:sulfur-oxidizing protein SoxY